MYGLPEKIFSRVAFCSRLKLGLIRNPDPKLSWRPPPPPFEEPGIRENGGSMRDEEEEAEEDGGGGSATREKNPVDLGRNHVFEERIEGAVP